MVAIGFMFGFLFSSVVALVVHASEKGIQSSEQT
jgi:hypothetical protein